MEFSAKHDDNIRLVKADKTAISGLVARPSMNFNANNETSTLGLNTTMSFARYNDSGFNTNDIDLFGAWNTQLERSSAGINLTAIRDSTTTSETRDSGRIGATADRHQHYAISPSWSYALTEVDSITVRADASKDSYDTDLYLGYKNLGISTDWTHALNETARAIVRISHSNYESDERTQLVPVYADFNPAGSPIYVQIGVGEQATGTSSRNTGGLVGVDYQFSEQNSLTALAGLSRVETDYSLNDPHNICVNFYSPGCFRKAERGNSFNAELDWKWNGEQHSTSLNVSKLNRPSSDGYPLDSWQLDANWTFRWSELRRLTTSASLGRNRISGSSDDAFISRSSNRDYGDAGVAYYQNISEDWQLSASYSFRYQKYTEIDYRADSRVVSLAIAYRPQASHWSR